MMRAAEMETQWCMNAVLASVRSPAALLLLTRSRRVRFTANAYFSEAHHDSCRIVRRVRVAKSTDTGEWLSFAGRCSSRPAEDTLAGAVLRAISESPPPPLFLPCFASMCRIKLGPMFANIAPIRPFHYLNILCRSTTSESKTRT